jgi:hypothetical protein
MKNRIVPILLAVLALAAALFGTNYWQKNYLASLSTIQVPVPKADIPPYTLLSADLFKLQEYPRALTNQGGYILSGANLNGMISVGALLAGLPVPTRMAVTSDQFRLADPALEVISIPAEAVTAAGAQIHIGEVINIYCLTPAPKQGQLDATVSSPQPEVAFVARVPVVAVLSDNGQPLAIGTDNNQGSTYQPQPMKILVVAAPHETVQTILDAIALMEHEGATLWVTLATP